MVLPMEQTDALCWAWLMMSLSNPRKSAIKSCVLGHNCKCSAHLTLLCGFCSLGCCRRGSHHSLEHSTGCKSYTEGSDVLILWASIQILASLTCACYPILLWFMLGMADVMNETVMLGYLLTDSIKKNSQTLVTVNHPPTFLLLATLSHFIPHNQNGWLLPTWVWSHQQWLFQDLTKQSALAGKQSQRHKHGSITRKISDCEEQQTVESNGAFFPSSHTLLVGGWWQREVWLCLVPARLQFCTWRVMSVEQPGAGLPSATQVPLWGQGQSCSAPLCCSLGGKMRMQPAAGWQESRNSIEHGVINKSAPFPRMMVKI